MRKAGPNSVIVRAAAGLAVLLLSASCLPSGPAAHVATASAPMPASPRRAVALQTVSVPVPAAPPALLLAPPPAIAAADGPGATAAPPFLTAAASPEDASRALDCLTAAVYYEARSEPVDGQRAVAQVVLNRVRNPAFPASVCGVVYQGANRRTGCQFTFTCDGSLLLGRREPEAWERAREVAAAALAGSVYEPVGAATYYHTSAIMPWWAPSLTRIAQVGAHIFYRLGSAWSSALDFRQSYAGAETGAGVAADPGVTPDAAVANVLRFVLEGGTVSVHHGDVATIAGVTVHRGNPSAAASDAPAAPTGDVTRTATADPAPPAAVAVRSAPAGTAPSAPPDAAPSAAADTADAPFAGVRVHRGTGSDAAGTPAPAAG